MCGVPIIVALKTMRSLGRNGDNAPGLQRDGTAGEVLKEAPPGNEGELIVRLVKMRVHSPGNGNREITDLCDVIKRRSLMGISFLRSAFKKPHGFLTSFDEFQL